MTTTGDPGRKRRKIACPASIGHDAIETFATGKGVYLDLFRYWIRIFAVTFAMGVVLSRHSTLCRAGNPVTRRRRPDAPSLSFR